MGQEVRAVVQAGKEVTIHESPITAHGWTGYGYTIIDPDTGAGAYLIEGRGNGSFLEGLQLGILFATTIALYAFTIPLSGAATALPAYLALIFAGEMARVTTIYAGNSDDLACFWGGFFFGLGLMSLLAGILTGGVLAGVIVGFLSLVLSGIFIPTNTALQCKAFFWQR